MPVVIEVKMQPLQSISPKTAKESVTELGAGGQLDIAATKVLIL